MIPIDLQALRGKTVYLLPLQIEDKEILHGLARDERIWEFTKTLMITDTYDHQFDRYFGEAMRLAQEGGQSFVIRLIRDDRVIGMTRFMDVVPVDKRLEIGHTWYIPEFWGLVHNKECKLLLLQYAFEKLKYNRVQFRVAHQNIRSQRAVEKIGAVKEGILRKHAYRMDGSIRHTVLFSIIDDEWPEKKEKLLQLIKTLSPPTVPSHPA